MANLRFRVLPRFPARLFADGGLKVTKAGADWTVSPDWGTLSVLSSISDSANSEVWVRVTSAGVSTYFRMTLASLISSLAQTGAGYSFVFTFDTTTTDADPGAGKLRLNQATQNTATVAYVDLTDAGGVDLTAILDSLDDTGSAIWSLTKVGDSTKRLLGTSTTVTSAVGYRKISIAVTGSSSASPFSNGDSVLLSVVRGGAGIITGSVDNAFLRADGVGGATSQGSPLTGDDTGEITFPERSAPSTPASNKATLYATSDGRFRSKDDAGAETQYALEVLAIACSDEITALTSGTNKTTFRMPFALTVTDVRGSLTTAQASGSIFTVDVNDSGTTILSTKLTIDNTEKTSTTAATARVISDTALADDAEITIDIDQVGDGTAKGLKVYIIGVR